MAKIESCITHPKEEDFFIVRRAYYELCGSDKVKAALLWVLEWFTTERMRNMRRRKETGDPWIEFSIEEMRNEMFGYLSHRRMPEALEELQNCGWVKIRKSGVLGGKSQYLLLIDVVQKRVNESAVTAARKEADDAAAAASQASAAAAARAAAQDKELESAIAAKQHEADTAAEVWAGLGPMYVEGGVNNLVHLS